MATPQYRSKFPPRISDLFERLRAQNCEPKTVDTIENWLGETAFTTGAPPPDPTPPLSEAQNSVPLITQATSPLRPHRCSSVLPPHVHSLTPKPPRLLPLQPSHGNRAPIPPRPDHKQKMSASKTPRQSTRPKKTTSQYHLVTDCQQRSKKAVPAQEGERYRSLAKTQERDESSRGRLQLYQGASRMKRALRRPAEVEVPWFNKGYWLERPPAIHYQGHREDRRQRNLVHRQKVPWL